jgi:O-methyltransferase involved in polyketide biosynthesis
MAMTTKVELDGVPGTLLWTLYHRAAEAARPPSGAAWRAADGDRTAVRVLTGS